MNFWIIKFNPDEHSSRRLGRLIATVVLAFLAMGGARAEQPDSLLSAYIAEALAHHPDLASMQAMAQAQEARVRMAGSWMNPNLMLGEMNVPTSLDFHEESMTMTQVGFMQRIPFPGKLGAAKKSQQATADASRADVEAMRLNMISMVRMAYYDLAGGVGINQALQEAQRRAGDITEAARIMVSSGLGNQADLLRAQFEYQQWGRRIIDTQKRIADARSRLALALGKTSTEGLQDPQPLAAPEPLPDMASLTGPALEATPARRAEEARLKAAEFGLKRARRDYWPDLDLTFTYGFRSYLNPGPDALAMGATGRIDQRDMLSLQVSLPLPLFIRNTVGAIVQENQAMLNQAQAQYWSGGIKLRDEVRQAYDRLQNAQSTYALISDTLMPSAEAAFQASLPAYESGKIPFMSLNEALMQVVMQRMDQAMSLADVHMARAELDRLVGKQF